ncbi:MAG TPA: tellurite resistance TerB C-terminal domain-containing protein [Aequorivita sp.]|nr:tellurite resistance TerB C-terminal domain-containing protein [Aequorivita sp.]
MKAFLVPLTLFLWLFLGAASPRSEIYEVTSDVFVRAGIGTRNDIVGVAKAGEMVTIVEKENPNWFKIEFADGYGYISSKFLRVVEQSSSEFIVEPIVEAEVEEKKTSYSGAAILILCLLLCLILGISRRHRNKKTMPPRKEVRKPTKLIPIPRRTLLKGKNFFGRSSEVIQGEDEPLKAPFSNLSGRSDFRIYSDILVTEKENVINKAPNWPEKSIFSRSAIDSASNEQAVFYQAFKQEFLAGKFLDLSGNTNYAFVLLYDLLADYEVHLDLHILETHLTNLGSKYSKTRSYANGFLDSLKAELATEFEPADNGIDEQAPSDLIENDKEDIIDVTKEPSITILLSDQEEKQLAPPFWPHQYVYSKADLARTSDDQKAFYHHFKQKFLDGVCLDLEENTNYAFVLLFDLIESYESHKNIDSLESQIDRLGNCYYKTRSYGVRFLNEIKRKQGLLSESRSNFPNYQNDAVSSEPKYYDSEPEYIYWKVGSKYKDKLNLNDNEVALLNKLWESRTNFCSIEFCNFQVIRLYLTAIAAYKKECESRASTIEDEFSMVSDLIARKHFRYRKGSANYKMSIKSALDEFYASIYKLSENAVREHYGHKRRLSVELNYPDPQIKEQFENKIAAPISNLLAKLVLEISEPDELTQKELNSLNTNRWKGAFQKICEEFSGDEAEFMAEIIALGEFNTKNPSIENIFFEASKFIASTHKESALILYLHYLSHDLKSAKFDNRQLTKTIQKNLFTNQEQIIQFELIVNEFLKDKDFEKALATIPRIYAKKRKKITLDRSAIEEAKQKHVGTVELLNNYLQEEEDAVISALKNDHQGSGEIEIHITSDQEFVNQSPFLEEIPFQSIHFQALELFAKNNFTVPVSEFELFAKSRGMFKNQLIESINDACYEVLDDLLIEEDEEFFTIETTYFQTISAK